MSAPHDLFGPTWTAAFADALGDSERYATAAATWEGSLVLEIVADTTRSVFLDLHRGTCRAARVADTADHDEATYLLSGDLATWKRVLAGEIDPLFGLMTGKLKLRRGSLAALTPYVEAARELVACARAVPTRFPDDVA
ncbi:MAG: SCP2 sterol-binding domain-containing protein [Acidobacteriota bacterium]